MQNRAVFHLISKHSLNINLIHELLMSLRQLFSGQSYSSKL